jgi:RimJ/RimL family protein N-acetyltransferase
MLPASPLLSSPVFHAVPVLETDRVRLRGYCPEDYLQFLAMSQNPDFYRYLGPGPMNAEEAWNKLLRGIGHWTLQGFGFWALEDKATGRYIGSAGFADFKRVLEPPLGSVPEAGWVLDHCPRLGRRPLRRAAHRVPHSPRKSGFATPGS